MSTPRRSHVVALDHVQLAMPPGREADARVFYGDVLGMTEVPKPPVLAASGGLWFETAGDRPVRLHLGIESDFRAAQKAHPALVARDLAACRAALEAAGHATRADDRIPERPRFYVDDPFGNRIEILAPE